jgi:hypothetical protein
MKNEYKTKDFYGACILRAQGLELHQIQFHTDNFASFIFNDPDERAAQIIKDYWDKQLIVDARTLIETINELKTRLHNKS